MKIAVVTDSGCGISKKEANAAGLYYLPLQIIIKDKMYLDGEDITVEELYDFLRQGEMPTTSLPPMGLIEELFHQLKEDGYDAVIAIPLTSGISSTASVINAIANDVGIRLYMVDCYTTCGIQHYLTMRAIAMVNEGLDAETIYQRLCESVSDSGTLIIPDDLQHLKRGGRLTPLAAALGGLLKIKPILKMNHETGGKIDVFDKVRTMSKAQQKAVDTFALQNLDDSYLICVVHSDAPEEGAKFKALVETAFPETEIYYGLIGAIISSHTGVGCLGIQYIKKI